MTVRHNRSVPSSPRQLLGYALIAALLALTAWWATGEHHLPDLPAARIQAPTAQRPLGTLEPWARAAANAAPALPARLTVAGHSVRVERHADAGIICPPRTGGCLLVIRGARQMIVDYSPRARENLRERLTAKEPTR